MAYINSVFNSCLADGGCVQKTARSKILQVVMACFLMDYDQGHLNHTSGDDEIGMLQGSLIVSLPTGIRSGTGLLTTKLFENPA